MTSLSLSRQNSEEDLSSYAVNNGATERKMGQIYSNSHAEYVPNAIKAVGKTGEVEVKNLEPMKYDIMKSDAISNNDVINRANLSHQCIARQRDTRGQPSVSPIVGFFAGIHKICNKTIVTLALILAIVNEAL